METAYREQVYYTGGYAVQSVYPVFRAGRKRRGRYLPTSDVQQRLNEENARERLARQLNANFDRNGAFVTLTYDDQHLPASREQLLKDFANFRRRLERRFGKRGWELMYKAVPHGDVNGTRMHIHMVVNRDLGAAEMDACWGKGIIEVSPLKFSRKTGLMGLARYMQEGMTWGRIMGSRNVEDPEARERTGRLSQKAVNRIGEDWDDPKAYEGLLPGYKVAAVKPFYNWFNRYFYLRIYWYKDSGQEGGEDDGGLPGMQA